MATITATNVTQQAKPPVPHPMLAKAKTTKSHYQLTQQMIDLLVKQNVISRELLDPRLVGQ